MSSLPLPNYQCSNFNNLILGDTIFKDGYKDKVCSLKINFLEKRMVLYQIMFSRKNVFISFDSIEGRKHRSSGSSHWLNKVVSNTIFQQMSDICVPQLFLPLNQYGNFPTNVQFISEVGANSVITNTMWFTRDDSSQMKLHRNSVYFVNFIRLTQTVPFIILFSLNFIEFGLVFESCFWEQRNSL